jgi:hypothetical protein
MAAEGGLVSAVDYGEAPNLPPLQLTKPPGSITALLEKAFPALYPAATQSRNGPRERKKATSAEPEQLPCITPNPNSAENLSGAPTSKGLERTSSRQGSARQSKGAAQPAGTRPGSKSGSKPAAQKEELSTSKADATEITTLMVKDKQLSSQDAASTADSTRVSAEGFCRSTSSSDRMKDSLYDERLTRIELACQELVQHRRELKQYLEQQLTQSKADDVSSLLEADAVFTHNHRKTGLPIKPSPLVLDHARLAQEGLLDPKEILAREVEKEEQAQMQPRTLEYLDMNAKGYLKTTSNLAVRQKMTLERGKVGATSHRKTATR